MRPIALLRFLLALPLAGLLAAAPPEAHTFTDTFGRAFSGSLIEATDTQAKVRRDDGQIFTLELAKLSDADAAYIAQWRKEHQAFSLRIETSQFHTKIGSNRSRDVSSVDQNMAAGYDIKVTNAAPRPAAGLRVEYNVFAMQYNFETITVQAGGQNGYRGGNGYGSRGNGITGGYTEIQQLVRQNGPPVPMRIKGSAPLDLAAFKASPLIRTAPLSYFKHSTMQTSANGGSLDYETGELQGIWVRVLSTDGKVVAEFVSNDSLRALGWQEVADKAASAAGR